MATTTNYSWTTPDDTDLVKDGAAAIRTLGSSADTTVKDLNPGTTAGDIDYYTSSTAKARVAIGTAGQVLKVNAGGTAPEWATTADQTPLTTKGDLFTFDTADARLGVGANGTVLTANSSEATGLEWAAPAAAGSSFSLLSTSTTNTGTEYSITGLSGYDKFMVVYNDVSSSSGARFEMRLNNDSTASGQYRYWGADAYAASGSTGVFFPFFSQATAYIPLGVTINAADIINGGFLITGANSTGFKQIQTTNAVSAVSGADSYVLTGLYEGGSVISSIQFRCSAGAFDAGTLRIYGSVA